MIRIRMATCSDQGARRYNEDAVAQGLQALGGHARAQVREALLRQGEQVLPGQQRPPRHPRAAGGQQPGGRRRQ